MFNRARLARVQDTLFMTSTMTWLREKDQGMFVGYMKRMVLIGLQKQDYLHRMVSR
jgi:hypothetical protein